VSARVSLRARLRAVALPLTTTAVVAGLVCSGSVAALAFDETEAVVEIVAVETADVETPDVTEGVQTPDVTDGEAGEPALSTTAGFVAGAADDPLYADFDYVGPIGRTHFTEGYRFALRYSCGPVEIIASCTEASGLASGDVVELRRTSDNGGRYTFTVTALDIDGRTATSSRSVTVVAPELQEVDATLIAETGSLETWNNGPVRVRVVPVVPDGTGHRSAYLSTGGLWSESSAGWLGAEVALEGRNRIHYFAATEGASGPVRDAFVNIDLTDPILGSVSPAGLLDASNPPAYTRGESVRVTFICSDALSGIAECGGDLELGDLLPTEVIGSHTLTILARDNAGNEVTRQLHYSVVPGDGTMRGWFTGVTPLKSSWFDGPGAIWVHVATNGSDEVVRVRASQGAGWGLANGNRAYLDFSGEGRHAFEWYGEDSTGAQSDVFSGEIGIDATDPTITTSLDGRGELRFAVGQNVPVRFSCADALSGIEYCGGDVVDGGALSTSGPGSYQVTLTARDLAGNETAREIAYVVDASLPQVPDAGGDPASAPTLPVAALAVTGGESAPLLVGAAILLVLGVSLLGLRVARR